jgi:hypothetical protein
MLSLANFRGGLARFFEIETVIPGFWQRMLTQQTAVSVRLEMISPPFFALNATDGAIRKPLVCHTTIDDANRKPAIQISENAYAFNLLAPGPAPDLLQAITREVCPANSHGMFQVAHERFCRI